MSLRSVDHHRECASRHFLHGSSHGAIEREWPNRDRRLGAGRSCNRAGCSPGPGLAREKRSASKRRTGYSNRPPPSTLEVAVYVPAKEDLAIGVEFAPRVVGILSPARADGFANQWITLATQLSTDGLLGLLPSDGNGKGGRKGHTRSKRKGKGKRH